MISLSSMRICFKCKQTTFSYEMVELEINGNDPEMKPICKDCIACNYCNKEGCWACQIDGEDE